MKLIDILNGRMFRILFSKKYAEETLKERKGKCNACGECCSKFLLGFPCLFYNIKKNKCRIYNIRPNICRNFPDKEALKRNYHKNCGYYFDERLKGGKNDV